MTSDQANQIIDLLAKQIAFWAEGGFTVLFGLLIGQLFIVALLIIQIVIGVMKR